MVVMPVAVTRELHEGRGSGGVFYLDDAPSRLEALCAERPESVQLIYMDPPYLTGARYHMRVRVGAEDWTRGIGSWSAPAYRDSADREAYLIMMRRVLAAARELLSETGLLFLHVDYRAHAHLRLLLDEIFGEKNFLNEIVWAYQSGGRSTRHFSRKHDIILLYAKGPKYDLRLSDVMETPKTPRDNHMRRHVDPDGRVYRSMRVGGRVYTYYDDEPVAPSDVWSNISHLQQKDPERTGYDTQKPLALLNRIVRCAARPGDTVLDPFAGSGTTLAAAALRGCDYIGIDAGSLTTNIARRRLGDTALQLRLPVFEGAPEIAAELDSGVGFYHIRPRLIAPGAQDYPLLKDPSDAVDGWSAGYLREDGYHVMAMSMRTRRDPKLCEALNLPIFSGDVCIALYDIAGRSYYYRLEP